VARPASWEARLARERAAIEKVAQRLLARYRTKFPENDRVPVPIDDIVQFVGLRVTFDDLVTMGFVEGVLAGTYAPDRDLFVDESLDPVSHPTQEGRYRFTLAHELGHWFLHRRGEQLNLFRVGRRVRIRDHYPRTARIEWHADYFAACLTMPRADVQLEWRNLMGHDSALLCDRTCSYLRSRVTFPPIRFTTRSDWHVATVMSRVFQVSVRAMKYRLDELDLLPDQDGVRAPSFLGY